MTQIYISTILASLSTFSFNTMLEKYNQLVSMEVEANNI